MRKGLNCLIILQNKQYSILNYVDLELLFKENNFMKASKKIVVGNYNKF